MRGVILDAGSLGADIDLAPITSLLDEWSVYGATRPGETAGRIKDATVALSNKIPLGAANLSGSQVRYISVMATGANNIDLGYAQANGIQVSNAVGYATPSVVQHTVALMLSLATSLPRYIQSVRQGDWARSDVFCLLDYPIVELAGKTLGIVGFGELGGNVAKAASGLGMDVIVSARRGQRTGGNRVAFEELLAAADVVSLHCPLTGETAGMINAETLALMKPPAFLINTARGGLVDSAALVQALKEGTIAGAAIDVLDIEPARPDEALLAETLPNLIVTPHNAWAAIESRKRLVLQMKENIEGYLRGEPPRLLN